ncbi:aldehyde dehydrogenase family protein [Streptomyces sp. NPDC058045]|uniref:aldehyde dehydrogenase family protein n=1 Tax=Streptomyces sp. NPDC058045 TaxID=3346311 RepID=UPI0036E390AA
MSTTDTATTDTAAAGSVPAGSVPAAGLPAPIDRERLSRRLFIGGRWVEGEQALTVVNPADESVICTVAAASPADVDAAVAAARAAYEGPWSELSGAERGRLLTRVADLIERDAELLAALEAVDIGKPVGQARALDVPNAAATFQHFAGWADKVGGQVIPTPGYFGRRTHSYTLRRPVGVVAAVVPWNSPLMIASWKLAPALAVGNTVVLKPPEDAPLGLLHLARLFEEAGLPEGVVNVVPGLGPVAGEHLVRHPGVDKISFTGSPVVGRRVAEYAARAFKPVTLELGGKSPQLVLPNADVEAAVEGCALGLFTNQGQVCAAGTRILVHRSHHARLVEGLAAAAERHVLGDPFAEGTTMGSLINAGQRDRVLGYVESAREEGARLVTGGGGPAGPGFFVRPTVFEGTNELRIAREEVFGPVGVVIPFDDTEEAVRLANDTSYGLAATLWTRDVSEAHLLAPRLRAGSVAVNGWAPLDAALPWGGVKDSGIGRELGWSGILANTEETTVSIVL